MDVNQNLGFSVERLNRRGHGDHERSFEEGLSGKIEFGEKKTRKYSGENLPNLDLKERIAKFNPEDKTGENQNFFQRFHKKGRSEAVQNNLVI